MSSETVETVLRTGTWILANLVPIAAAWIATCWIKRSPATMVGRSLFAGFLVFASSAWIHERAMQPFSRAIWRCSVCGTSEYQVRFSDRVVYRTGRHASYDKTVAAIASGVPHEHDWLYSDFCLAFGDSGQACSLDLEDAYFSCLGKMPSPEIARGMIARVASAPRAETRDDPVVHAAKPRRALRLPRQGIHSDARAVREGLRRLARSASRVELAQRSFGPTSGAR